MPIRYLILDWSGTVSDDRRVVFEANRRMREDYGLPAVVFDEWLSTATMTAYEHFAEAGVDVGPDALHAHYERRLNEVVADGLRPVAYERATEVLARLAEREGIRLGIVSSHPTRNLLEEMETYGVRERFVGVIGGSRDKAPDIARMARGWNANPSETLYVGDTVHDIRHAKRALVQSAGITTGYHPRAALAKESPDFLFESLGEIETALGV